MWIVPRCYRFPRPSSWSLHLVDALHLAFPSKLVCLNRYTIYTNLAWAFPLLWLVRKVWSLSHLNFQRINLIFDTIDAHTPLAYPSLKSPSPQSFEDVLIRYFLLIPFPLNQSIQLQSNALHDLFLTPISPFHLIDSPLNTWMPTIPFSMMCRWVIQIAQADWPSSHSFVECRTVAALSSVQKSNITSPPSSFRNVTLSQLLTNHPTWNYNQYFESFFIVHL